MKKVFKRIAAGGMALITMSILTVSTNATTRSSEDVYWAVDYIQGAPSSVSTYECVRTVGPFPKGFCIDCCELSGMEDPVVIVKSDALGQFTMGSVGSYQFDPSSDYKGTRFELHFCAGAPRTKANGYVYSK